MRSCFPKPDESGSGVGSVNDRGIVVTEKVPRGSLRANGQYQSYWGGPPKPGYRIVLQTTRAQGEYVSLRAH